MNRITARSPELEVRFTPNSGHSEAHAGLPLVTHSGSRGSPIRDTLNLRRHRRRIDVDVTQLPHHSNLLL